MADPTVITPVDILGPFDAITALDAEFVFTALTVTDGDSWICNGRDILLVYNPSGADLWITITSVDDEFGRGEDITTYDITTLKWAAFGVGLTNSKGWKDTAGKIKVTPESADLDAVVLRLPTGFGR